MTGVEQVRIGSVLSPSTSVVEVEADKTYRIAGMYSFGKGLFERAPILGADTSYRRLNRLHTGQLVVSKLNGWEGALDIVDHRIDGCHVSGEYPAFDVDPVLADPAYIRWVARWPGFWERLVPRGSMVRRKRVQISQFLETHIPLPPIEKQRRVAAQLDLNFDLINQLRDRQRLVRARLDALTDAIANRAIATGEGWAEHALAEIADVNPARTRLEPGTPITFVPMAAVDAYTGSVKADAERRKVGEIASGYRQFRRGDILFARITPCMQNGKCAVFDGSTAYGYGSSEFHVVRPHDPELTPWIHQFLRAAETRQAAQSRMTGTAGQQRVPAAFLRELRVPLAPQAVLQARTSKLDARTLELRRVHTTALRAEALSAAVGPSILNGAFATLATRSPPIR